MNPGLIVTNTAREHGLPAALICGGDRATEVVAARHDAIHRLRRDTDLSLIQIARQVGLTNHTTVLAALAKPQPQAPGLEWLPGPTVCVFEDCSRDVWARGWCHAHYEQWNRTGKVWPVRDYGQRPPDPQVCDQGRTPWGYRRGCGCEKCRKAWAGYQVRWRDGVRATVDATRTRHRLGELRESMTLAEISDQCGVAPSSLSMIERGLVPTVKRATAQAIADVVKVCEDCNLPALAEGRWCGVGRCTSTAGRWSWSTGKAAA